MVPTMRVMFPHVAALRLLTHNFSQHLLQWQIEASAAIALIEDIIIYVQLVDSGG